VTAVQFAYINTMSTLWRGRVLHDVALPGDEDEVLARHVRRAQQRDEWWSPKEFDVYRCSRFQLMYDTPWCFNTPCTWCGNYWDHWG
jgi:hypothetical protein